KHSSPLECPLCESTEKIEGLADRIKNRMNAFASLQAVQAEAAAAGDAVKRAEQHLQLVREGARQDVAKFEECRSSGVLPGDIPVPDSPVPNSASGLASWLAASAALTAEWKKAETARHDKQQFIRTLR